MLLHGAVLKGDGPRRRFQNSDDHASRFISDYFNPNSTITPVRKDKKGIEGFLCNDVCRLPEEQEQAPVGVLGVRRTG